MCEGRDVTRPHPTEIPYLLAFFPSLRAASDRTLSVYFPIRPDAYDARFYEGELKRIVEKHWHKLSDEDREVSAVSYKRLYLAGPDEAVAELEKLLPPSLKKIIAGRLSASIDRSVGELENDIRKQLSLTRA